MSALIDQDERTRFVLEQEKNISVIAPAGVGKTTSIVARIVHLARLPEAQAVDRLSRLVVVTYSVRAAQQMQQKARVAIRNAAVSPQVQRAFQQTFFGTIHSYCVRLLERFGHYLGLPSPVALLEADDDLWNRFLIRGLGQDISRKKNLRDLFHFYSPEKLYALGREISPGLEIDVQPLPTLDWQRLLDYQDAALHPGTKKSIARAQESAKHWSEAWVRGERFRSLPKCPESDKAAAFAEIWRETFTPLHDWLRGAALAFGRHVANAYEKFRLSEVVMTYDDQVRLSLRVLELPAVRRELASEKLSVLLDEAQDTDPRQFEVLRLVAGLGGEPGQAEDQSFCIVGDFQQAIYAPRSDLGIYRKIHDEISAEPRGTSCRLQVTFRCDQAIIRFVNRIFPAVLDQTAGQCAFETLVARDKAGPGQVVRWACPDEPDHAAGKKISAEMRARHEARFLARRIQELGPAGFGASGWSQVAILCPRKNWLFEIQRELAALGLPVQLHSSDEQQRDRAPVAWLTSLIWIAAHPEDSFEIAGVLREILGVSDSDMALYTGGDGDKLRLDRPVAGEGPVEIALDLLREACAQTDAVPLHQAARRLLEKTRLRERLDSIAEMKLENANRELDDFLAVIDGRAAEGATLAELAEELRLGLEQVHPAEEEIRDAIQLLTSHKAKGLEWQAVIVPYVFRTIESKSLPYPRVVIGEGGGEIVCRDKADYDARARPFVTERDRRQLQRLLYVMSTRAKRTLVLIDDETLFADQTRRGGWSAGDLLGFVDGDNRTVWSALPEALVLSEELSAIASVPETDLVRLPNLSPDDVRLAVERAGRFPRRITPHALALHARDEAEPETQIEREDDQPADAHSPAILYGTWWHECVQTIPWRQSPEDWQRKFVEARSRSPLPQRAAREWDLFRRSELARWLAEPGRLIQVELPFLWRSSGEEACLEGVIDLAVYAESESAWRVIDWKTNRVGPGGSAALVEVYRGQIEAYVRVLREMLSAEVRGSLYLTQTGEWAPVE
ncbi:MAG: UvrD-helicase domain-containing protein [Methylacidiphilales bacterium]|nr:UvrD-helicase domain-containing protein [Candidatus Methylacidiphilales bacterium]